VVTGHRRAWRIAADTPDPELPVVTIEDLGILRAVDDSGDTVAVTITPTYSGCPAIPTVAADLTDRLRAAGYRQVDVRTRLAPPWSSDWITERGRQRLADAGIAPPDRSGRHVAGPLALLFAPAPSVRCPRCGSVRTRRVADCGATACRQMYRCEECREPFDAIRSR
jgi:ring-1,2-phenylacetyl-CoA epoxidase subunit PaaD